jgi:hypothetical protein
MVRGWHLYEEFARSMIAIARSLYVDDLWGPTEGAVYTPDTTTIHLCLRVFSWAQFQLTKTAVKLYQLLDLGRQHPGLHPYQRQHDTRGHHPRSAIV